MSKVLTLTLKKKWFDMIASGEKKEEYREVKPHWINRIYNRQPINDFEFEDMDGLVRDLENGAKLECPFKTFDTIKFKNGYSSNAPTITVQCLGISIGTAKPEWSDNWQGQVFVIKLGDIIKPQTT